MLQRIRSKSLGQFYRQSVHLERIYTYRLKICAESKAIWEGRALHCQIIKLLAEPRTTLMNSLANLYSKCGSISLAEQVFDEMPERDVVSWNTMISGYLSTEHPWKSFICFKMMLDCCVLADHLSLIGVLKACVMSGDLSGGVQVHGLAVKLGLCDDAFVSNGLIDLYDEFDCFEKSADVFDALTFKDLAVINTMIRVYVKMGNVEKAFENVSLLLSDIRGPMQATFVNLLRAISDYGSLREGVIVHGLTIKLGVEGQGAVENSLVRMYCRCDHIDEAFELLLDLHSENVMSWTTLISQCNIHGHFQEAMHVFQWLHHYKVVGSDEFMLACVLSASAASKCLCFGTQMHSIIIRRGIGLHKGIVAALIDMYSSCFCLEDMYKVRQQVGHNCDLLIWTTVISGNVHNGLPMEALRHFSQMLSAGVRPDAVACVSLLTGCIGLKTVEHGEMVHSYVTKSGNVTKSSVQTALISLYSNFGCFNSAEKILSRMIEYDIVSVTALISGYAKLGHGIDAFSWFRNTLSAGISPNNCTLASALMASAKLTALSTGRSIHSLIIRIGLEGDKFVASSLIDMYSKCGAIEDAVHYFSRTEQEDIVVWNSLLAGHAHHGSGEEVLKVFDKMLVHGIKPDGITFLSVLSGCSHGGLTDQVMEYFFLMRDAYGISPMAEHYACVVDSLGRAGLLKKAVNFIETLDFDPGMLILRSLLSSCILHGQSELGLAVVAKMIMLGDDEVATYALFSKLSANEKRWGDVMKAREMMNKKVGQSKKDAIFLRRFLLPCCEHLWQPNYYMITRIPRLSALSLF